MRDLKTVLVNSEIGLPPLTKKQVRFQNQIERMKSKKGKSALSQHSKPKEDDDCDSCDEKYEKRKAELEK